MAKREDEYWASQKQDLRYCSKHKRYYKADIGCQLCYLDRVDLEKKVSGTSRLQKCPNCAQKSLFWNRRYKRYECLDAKCRLTFMEAELRGARSESSLETPSEEGGTKVSQSVSSVADKKEEAHCEREADQSLSTARPWFGNEYFDFETRKWQKPGRARISWTAGLILLLTIASLAIVFYVLSNLDQLDLAVGIAVISAAVLMTIWHIMILRRLWRYRFRKASSREILSSMVLVSLIGCAAAMFAGGIAPLGTSAGTGPSDIGLFIATPGNMQITLSWDKGNDVDQVVIRYKTTGYPASVTDGTLVYRGVGTSCSHTNLDYGSTYYYGIWTMSVVDGEMEYSDGGKFTLATPSWLGPDGESIHEYVECGGWGMIVGADGGRIELFNNPEAENATWEELEQFLWEDETDRHIYNEDSFVCADFAEMLHNNAESAGIRAAYVSVELKTWNPWLGGWVVSIGPSHSLNVFNTLDRGLVYIDCTGTENGELNADKTVEVVEEEEYIPVSIFSNPGYEGSWESMGVVTDVYTQW